MRKELPGLRRIKGGPLNTGNGGWYCRLDGRVGRRSIVVQGVGKDAEAALEVAENLYLERLAAIEEVARDRQRG